MNLLLKLTGGQLKTCLRIAYVDMLFLENMLQYIQKTHFLPELVCDSFNLKKMCDQVFKTIYINRLNQDKMLIGYKY